MGLDGALLQTVPARHVYHPDEILVDKRFADILKPINDGTMWMIDSSQFDLWSRISCHARSRRRQTLEDYAVAQKSDYFGNRDGTERRRSSSNDPQTATAIQRQLLHFPAEPVG
jgi:hypothetical protein